MHKTATFCLRKCPGVSKLLYLRCTCFDWKCIINTSTKSCVHFHFKPLQVLETYWHFSQKGFLVPWQNIFKGHLTSFLNYRRNEKPKIIENNILLGILSQKGKLPSLRLVPTISKSMWVFGYGSLIWKADFPYRTKLVGYIKGYKRRFYQHSVDHRGRPHKPGRVVTLIPSHEEDKVWGVAYEIYNRDENFVTAHLDYREKTGYEKHQVLFYPTKIVHLDHSEGDGVNEIENLKDSTNCKLEPFQLIIYIGTEENKWFAGPASIEEIAKQISESEGPSGTNKEYLFNLAKSMRTMAPYVNDEHLFALEKAVLDLEKQKN